MKVDFNKKMNYVGTEMPMMGPVKPEIEDEEFAQLEGSGMQKHPAKPAQPTKMKYLD